MSSFPFVFAAATKSALPPLLMLEPSRRSLANSASSRSLKSIFRCFTISTRSADKLGNFAGPHASTRDQKLRVALDVLVDLSLMARCQYFLHGASAVAEAAHYTNPALHRRSVDLEYEEDARALLNGSGGRLPWL